MRTTFVLSMLLVALPVFAQPVAVCITSANAASGLVDAASTHATAVRAALAKDKDAKALLALVDDCAQAAVVVTVSGTVERRTEQKDVMDFTKRSGTSLQTSQFQTLRATLAVSTKAYETELVAERLVNMFSVASVDALLAKEVRKWVKANGATLAPGT